MDEEREKPLCGRRTASQLLLFTAPAAEAEARAAETAAVKEAAAAVRAAARSADIEAHIYTYAPATRGGIVCCGLPRL